MAVNKIAVTKIRPGRRTGNVISTINAINQPLNCSADKKNNTDPGASRHHGGGGIIEGPRESPRTIRVLNRIEAFKGSPQLRRHFAERRQSLLAVSGRLKPLGAIMQWHYLNRQKVL